MTEHERRRFQRIFLERPISLVAGGGIRIGTLIDISLHGALIALEAGEAPEIGTTGTVDIALCDDPEFLIRMQIEIAHVEGRHVGMRTTEMALEDACRLRRLVELNLEQTGLLQRELEELG